MEATAATQVGARRRFCLVLVKPSHYDDDGYVLQWMRSPIPSNSLASLFGLAKDCADRKILGDDVDIEIHALDETNTRIRPDRLAAMIEEAGAGMVMLTGVQSNQFPRALDLARPLRARGIQVGIGGFHVSGVLSMLNGVDADLDRAKALGLSLFAGEAEGRLDEVLHDAAAGQLKPLYNYMDDLPSIEGTPIPLMAVERAQRTAGGTTSFDAGRGCPYQCSFCTNISFVIQIDTLCHKLPPFIEKCARAGVKRVFIGLENINPDNLAGAKKKQNKITEYREMLLAWKNAGVITYAGYILGFPNDSYESIMHDIDVIKRELPVDLLEFFYLTPLPGSEDHLKLHRAGAPLDPDLNKYDLNHICTTHPRMSREEWDRSYKMAWQRYYTIEHVETVLRRVATTKANASNALFLITWFMGSINIENIHPLESGFLRLKFRRDRRASFPREAVWWFYPKYFAQLAAKLVRWTALYFKLRRIYLRIKHDPQRYAYTDIALTAVADDEAQTHELFGTGAAQAYIAQAKRVKQAQDGHGHVAEPMEAVE